MNKNLKKILIILLFFVAIVNLINKILQFQYDLNIYQYITRSSELTESERRYIEENPVLIYGADQNSPPLRYVDKETGQYRGISIDIIQALSIELGVEIKIKPFVFNDSIKNLEDGNTDMCDLFPSEDRKNNFLFSDYIYNLRGVIAVKSTESEISRYNDLENRKVAVPKGDYSVEFLKNKTDKIKFNFTEDMEQALQLLSENKVDAVVGDEPVISYFLNGKNMKNKIRILDNPLYENKVVLAVPKSEPQLLSILNKGIYGIKEKKVIEKIQQKWFGISVPINVNKKISSEINIYLSFIIIIFLLISFIMYYWNEKLRKEVEKRTEELYISRNNLQTTFDGIGYFMVLLDKQCIISNINKAFCNSIGLTKERLIGLKIDCFKNVLCKRCENCAIKKTLISGEGQSAEISYNNRVLKLNTFSIRDKNEEVTEVLASIEDITELKISEKQLLQSNKMVAVGHLAAGIAHEIRNPLGIIRNYNYILKSILKDFRKENKKLEKAITAIDNSVERASSIIENLLNFSRISDNESKRISIKDFMDNILNLQKTTLEKKNILIDFEMRKDIVCNINEESLKHILINLIDNSQDAMEHGGYLIIRCYEKDSNIIFIIKDNGCGIEKKNIHNIFNPFFTTKPPGKGTGLGLYITYNEVEKLGGEIKVFSKIDVGTSFHVKIPILNKQSIN